MFYLLHVFLLMLVSAIYLTGEIFQIENFELAPVLVVSFGNFLIYWHSLFGRFTLAALADIGFILTAFLMLYTSLPTIVFQFDILKFTMLGELDPTSLEIYAAGLRNVAFIFVCQAVYLQLRGSTAPIFQATDLSLQGSVLTLLLLILCFGGITAALGILSAPVETYYDNYTRYDHHSGVTRKLISVLVRIYNGIVPFLILLLVSCFGKRPALLVMSVAAICVADVVFTNGARINSLSYLIQAIVLFSIMVRKLKGATLLLLLGSVLLSFTFVELWRLSEDNLQELVENSVGIAGEFMALHFTGIHLFRLRETGFMPDISNLFLLGDFVQLIPFFDLPESNSMIWYWDEFYPKRPVAPFTMGPIADSAIYGGSLALLIRGLLTGVAIYSLLRILTRARLPFLLRVSIYSYGCGNAVLLLKYGFLTVHSHIVMNWLLGFCIFYVLNVVSKVTLGTLLAHSERKKQV